MVHSIVFLLIFGGVVPCCISAAPSVRGNYGELFRGYSLKQRIAYRIGQVECLKSLCLGGRSHGAYSTVVVLCICVCVCVCLSVCRQDFSSLAEN